MTDNRTVKTSPPDKNCNIKRRRKIQEIESNLFTYTKDTEITKNNIPDNYQTKNQLREWSEDEIKTIFASNGFTFDSNLTNQIHAGETYLLFKKSNI